MKAGSGAERDLIVFLEDRVRLLTGTPLFEGTPPSRLAELSKRAQVIVVEDEAVILAEGEEGLGFYIIVSGSARVVREGKEVARLGPGDFFGGAALLEQKVRSATVVASGRTVLMGILRSDFKPLLSHTPRIALRILEEEDRRQAGQEGSGGGKPRC